MTTSCSPLASVASLNGGKRTDGRGVGFGSPGGGVFSPYHVPVPGARPSRLLPGGGVGGVWGWGGPPPGWGGGGRGTPRARGREWMGSTPPGGRGGPFPRRTTATFRRELSP